METSSSHFLAATAGNNKGPIPVWFMRQAGRYLPEYQELRKKYDFRTMSHEPDLICKTTLLPLEHYPLDAAILFSDILTSLEYMGAPFRFTDEGPQLELPGLEALKRLTPLDPIEHMGFVGKGIRLIKENLKQRQGQKVDREQNSSIVPLIGFAGAPFTILSYLIEGGTSRDFEKTKKFLLSETSFTLSTLNLLAESIASYLKFQVESGADAVQIFDSWAGVLSHDQYRDLIFPCMKKLISTLRTSQVPVILYTQPTSHLLPLLAQSGATAVSVDWRLPLKTVADTIDKFSHEIVCIQGNLDPVVTTLPWTTAKPYVEMVLKSAAEAGILNRYIFNVGHGVVPQTKIETLRKIVEMVHEFRRV